MATSESVESEITLTLFDASFATNTSPRPESYASPSGLNPTLVAVTVLQFVARTLSVPLGDGCTVNVQGVPLVAGKLPSAFVAQLEVAKVPAKVKLIESFAANPVPVAATLEPTRPVIGDSTRLEFTVNSAVAVLVPLNAVTISGPFGAAGTVKLQAVPVVPGKLPFESVAHVDGAEAPASVNPMVEFAGKPVP